MKTEFKDLESIVLEETYVFPPEGIYKLQYRLTINRNGLVEEISDKTNYYKTNKKDIEELHAVLIDFIDKARGINEYIDNTARTLKLNYEFKNIDVSSELYDENGKCICELIEEFLKEKCKVISEKEAETI